MAELIEESVFEERRESLQKCRFPMLSKGGLTLIDASGPEQRVVQAARTTSNLEGLSNKDDRNLLRYLMRHSHSTPYEFIDLIFLVECPMDVWRQWIR